MKNQLKIKKVNAFYIYEKWHDFGTKEILNKIKKVKIMIENLEDILFGKTTRYSLSYKETKEIKRDLKNSNIMITGAAGSIGSIFTKNLKKFDFNKLYLIDKDEHLLAELARLLNIHFKSKINKINFICSDINTLNLNKFLKSKILLTI